MTVNFPKNRTFNVPYSSSILVKLKELDQLEKISNDTVDSKLFMNSTSEFELINNLTNTVFAKCINYRKSMQIY